MIFPLPLLAFVFLAQPLYRQLATKNLRRFAALLLVPAAVCVFVVNLQNVGEYLFRFRTSSHYNPRLSPEIFSFSQYINEHGLEAQSVVCVDWGLHNQLHALASKKLQPRMHDYWPAFQKLGKENQKRQSAVLNFIFPEGKNLALTFAASKETFPKTRQNFLAALASHPALKCGLLKEFWYGGEKIYEVYEIERRLQQQVRGRSECLREQPISCFADEDLAANSQFTKRQLAHYLQIRRGKRMSSGGA